MSRQDDYLFDRDGAVDPEIERLERLLSPLAHDRPLDELRLRRARSRAPWIAGAMALLAAAAVLALVLRGATTAPGGTQTRACAGDTGFRFTAGGAVACDGATTTSGVLPVGAVLDTGTSTAQLEIADIGTAQLSPGTRVRLDRTDPATRHQLHLERGRMHAVVDAPPRIFAVTTPSTSVVDLGCEYTVEIDARGQGSIEVVSGKVELDTGGDAVIVVPAGASARLLAGRRPSLPVASGAGPELRAAVLGIEQGLPQAIWDAPVDPITRLLAAATPDDLITVVNLAALAPPPRRTVVLARLAQLMAPPDGVTVELAVTTPAAFERWRDEVVLVHLENYLIDESTRDLNRKN